jgi:hypothetical protein
VPALALGAAACQVSTGGKAGSTGQASGGSSAGSSGGARTSIPDPAMTAPDQTAWTIFIDAVKPSGSAGITFDTWATDADTFSPGARPTTSEKALLATAPRPSLHAPVLPSMRGLLRSGQSAGTGGKLHALAAGMASGPSAGPPNPPPPGLSVDPSGNPTGCDSTGSKQTFEPACDSLTMENVRRNPAAYDYIVNNHLNSVSGLQKAYQAGFKVDFPTDAIEIKMNWLPASALGTYYPGVPQNQFYLADFLVEGKKVQFALIAMHVISKQVPNWTWATFEHQGNRGRCDFVGCHDAYGATTPDVAPANDASGKNQGTVYAGCAKTQALLDAFKAAGVASVFNNYCLKGSQTDFTDNNGLAVRVGNSVTESTFVPQASCMTCHGEANVTSAGKATSIFGFFNGNGQIGGINPILVGYWTLGGPAPGYTPYQGMPGLTRNAISADFVWSIPFCAYDDVSMPHKASRCAGK